MVTFVDTVTLHLKAGDGGNGCVSVRREKFKPLAGPDGGNGGDGGSITLVAERGVTTLLEYHRRPHRKATNGSMGMGDLRNGAKGEDILLTVPLGTVVKDSKTGDIIEDMTRDGQTLVIAEGGQGGLGNASLASTKRKAPGFALLGTLGWEGDVVLELKSMADVALVGFPSAGKSSLIAAISAAKPKIADYPFTTLAPNLGVVEYGETRFTVADVPGLIEGASEGKGLGLEFLRHIERCSVIAHVIDTATLDNTRAPMDDFQIVLNELAKYPVEEGEIPLIERPQLVVLNKADVPEARDLAELVKPDFEEAGYRVFIVSAVTKEGLDSLGYALAELVAEHRASLPEEEPTIQVLQPKRFAAKKEFVIEKDSFDGDVLYRIIGEKPERWVQQTDFTNDEAIGFLSDRLAKLDVDKELFKAGAVPGDAVVIGAGDGQIFDWEPTISSATEMTLGNRGTDVRLDPQLRPTRKERKANYHEMMDAKAAVRAELESERLAEIAARQNQSTDTESAE